MSLSSSSIQDDISSVAGKPSEKAGPASPNRKSPDAPITQLSSPRGTKRKASSSASASSGLSSPPRSPIAFLPTSIVPPIKEGTQVKPSSAAPLKSAVTQATPSHTTSSSETSSSSTPAPSPSDLPPSFNDHYLPQYSHKAHALNVFNLTDSGISNINNITDIELLDIYMYKLLSRLDNEMGSWKHVREMSKKEAAIFEKLAARKRNLYMGDVFEGLLWCDGRGWV